MPPILCPKDEAELVEWKKICSGEKSENCHRNKAKRIRETFIVSKGRLIHRELNKPVLVLDEFDFLFEKHHTTIFHPGRDVVRRKMYSERAQIPYNLLQQKMDNCQVCHVKGNVKKPPLGKPITGQYTIHLNYRKCSA